MIGIGLVGYGYWGPNLLRNFNGTGRSRVVHLSELRPKQLQKAASLHPDMACSADAAALIADPRVDVVAIATPVRSHFELAMAALRGGKHVFIAKPICETLEQSERLLDFAAQQKLTVHVDHTFLYTGAVRKIREIMAGGSLGRLLYFDSTRINLGLFQSDVNVLWDLAVHDLSILDHIYAERPLAISALGARHVADNPENMACLTLFYGSGAMAHINVNWLAPVKIRRTLIGGDRRMIVYDDVEPSEKVKIYDKGVDYASDQEGINKTLVSYRTGDVWVPKLDMTEALGFEINHFFDGIESNAAPMVDPLLPLRVINVLEAASRSMRDRGRPIELGSIASVRAA